MNGLPMIERVAVLGAGRMGSGIAFLFAEAGHDVRLYDATPAALAAARANVERIAVMLEGDPSLFARLRYSDSLADAVEDATVVIEAVTEKLAVKQDVFRQVEGLVSHDTLLATNTSAIPVAHIGSALVHAGRFVGMHFWNPPHLVPLVEVVQSERSALTTVDRAMGLLASIGMSPVHVRRDIPGFIGNRLQHALKREAIALVAAGVCDAETLDEVVKTGFGSRLSVLGPLEQSDMVGLGLTLDIHDVLIEDLDRTAGPHPYLKAKVAAGETGMARGQGFRAWTAEQADAVRARLDQHLVREARARRQALRERG